MRAELVGAHAALDEAVAVLRDGRARPHERIKKAAKDFLTDVDLASSGAMAAVPGVQPELVRLAADLAAAAARHS